MSQSLPAPGTIIWSEIPAPDLDAARAFYGAVFGWSFNASNSDDYLFFDAGEGLGGGFDRNMEPGDRGVALYIHVADIPESLARIAESGGSVLAGKTKISDEYGFYGIFKDPAGNRLGVWSKT